MTRPTNNPRILIVTPEVTQLPAGMGNITNFLSAKAGGLADVSAALISALYEQGADVHVALPDYKGIFNANLTTILGRERKTIRNRMPVERIHLAEDRAFYYRHSVYSRNGWENINVALAFQREVINNIVPRVMPDLIHCNDWMTGLIPAMSRQLGIPCLFTIHNIHTKKILLSYIEERGIDAAYFWQRLYYENVAFEYEKTREDNPVDLLTSAVFAAHFVNTVSPTFLRELVNGEHSFVTEHVRQELSNKFKAGCTFGILNAPDPSYNPSVDKALSRRYNPKNHPKAKRENKLALQKKLGLIKDSEAPLFFWPSRLDTLQKGCQLLAEILYDVVSRYWGQNLEIVFVAGGEFNKYFKEIVSFHNFSKRVAICNFDDSLARLAYGAADFIIMPSLFEPCGLPQMIGTIYGALPVAHDTGGIHDTIVHLDASQYKGTSQNKGNGFLFKTYDSPGLMWAINQAMGFYNLPKKIKKKIINRIMTESTANFNHDNTARQYINLYEKMLQRPLINTIE